MVHDGALVWRMSKTKQIDLHVILLEDILVLLQKQDEKLVLKCQTSNMSGKEDTKFTHSPILKLTNLLTRNVATGKYSIIYNAAKKLNWPKYWPQVHTQTDQPTGNKLDIQIWIGILQHFIRTPA